MHVFHLVIYILEKFAGFFSEYVKLSDDLDYYK